MPPELPADTDNTDPFYGLGLTVSIQDESVYFR